jgi:hypothetical protein
MTESDRPALDEVEPGVPATTELPDDVPPGWEAAEEPPPLDFPQGVESWGTTAEEELQGEPLSLRVLREEPEAGAGDEASGVSVLEPGAESGLTDDEPDAVGELDTENQVLSPEESAMRVEEDPAGLTYDAGPGYLDDELGS